MLCYIIKYYNFILILLKEISLLFVFIFFKIFKIFLLLGEGILNVLIVCLEIFDEMFPNFKNIFKPFGGMSIFYATLYYYIFV